MNVPENLPEGLALLNAILNGTAAVLLVLAYRAIRARELDKHRRLMLSAFGVSCAFLVSYLTRYGIAGDTAFQGQGILRPIYFTILITHVLFAMVLVPLVLRTLYLSLRARRFTAHRKIARFTLPIWMYVSVTGVVVYLMLYQLT